MRFPNQTAAQDKQQTEYEKNCPTNTDEFRAEQKRLAKLPDSEVCLFENMDAEPSASDNNQIVEYKLCDCGCKIPARSVMSTSTGTSCCECYDRMSGAY